MKIDVVRRMLTLVGAATVALGAAMIAAPTAPRASAAMAETIAPPKDKITKKGGEVIEGKITKEVEGWVWFTQTANGVDTEVILNPKDIEKIERASDASPGKPGDGAGKPGTDAKPAPTTPDDPKARKPHTGHRAAVLTLEGEVGIQFSAKPLDEAIPMLEEEGIDTVVLKVNSGGGLLLEIQRLSDVIHEKYKQKFRTVGWIESAISAAAMSSHCIEEIYFKPEGNYGACTGWSGALTAVKGRGLEEVLLMMEKISARSRRPAAIMRAMQISSDEGDLSNLQISPPSGQLSADINPTTGEVTWYQSLAGQYTLNPKGGVRILTFNSEEAAKFKFSNGTADSIQELAVLMKEPELEWVGKEVKGVAFPVCKAEEHQRKWRAEITEKEENFRVYFAEYARNVQTAQAQQNREDRGLWIGKARTALNGLKNIAKKFPNIALLQGLEKQWFDQQEELLRKLAK